MGIFKSEKETKRVIFNVDIDLVTRLDRAKECARLMGKKLDVETAIDNELEKFLKKAEKKFIELGVDLAAVKMGEQTEDNEPLKEPSIKTPAEKQIDKTAVKNKNQTGI
nr:hypothetical protein [Desulfobulbaceae bacterium]